MNSDSKMISMENKMDRGESERFENLMVGKADTKVIDSIFIWIYQLSLVPGHGLLHYSSLNTV